MEAYVSPALNDQLPHQDGPADLNNDTWRH